MNSIIERGLVTQENSLDNDLSDIGNIVNVTNTEKDKLSLVERGFVKPEPKEDTINAVSEILRKSAEESISKLPDDVDDVSFFEAIELGWQESITGMLSRGKLPEKRLSDDASLFDVATSAVSSEIADIWVTLGSAKAGAAAGTAVAPGLGTAVGAFGGAVSIPSGIREAIVASMEKGEVQTWEDFADITKRAGTQALMGLGVGVATLGAGKITGNATSRFLNNKNINNLTKKGSKYVAEFLGQTTAMTTSMGVMKGEIPDSQDFVRSAVTMLAINGAERVVTLGGKGAIKATKETTKTIRDVYKKHGIKPSDLSKLIKADKTVHEDVVSDLSTPRALSDPDGLEVSAKKVAESIVSKEPETPISIGEVASNIYKKTIDSMHPVRKMMESLADGDSLDTAANVYIKSTMQRTTPLIVLASTVIKVCVRRRRAEGAP